MVWVHRGSEGDRLHFLNSCIIAQAKAPEWFFLKLDMRSKASKSSGDARFRE